MKRIVVPVAILVNAFLTLRIGCLAAAYCRSLTMPSQPSLRRAATAEAATMLAAVASHGGGRVASAIRDAARRSTVGAAQAAARLLARTATNAATRTSSAISDAIARKRPEA